MEPVEEALIEENKVVILLNILSSEFDFKCKAIFEERAGPYNTGLINLVLSLGKYPLSTAKPYL